MDKFKSVNLQTMEADDLPQFRQWLSGMLKLGIVTVTFAKSDGTVREMRATLDGTLIPTQPIKEDVEPKTRKVNADVLAVWSVDDGGWRSFRLDRVQRVQLALSAEQQHE